MARYAFFAVLLGFFVACASSEDSEYGSTGQGSSSSSGSSGSTSASGGTGGSAGGFASGSNGVGGASTAACDDVAMCGDYVNGCTGCAVSSLCAEVYDGCFGDESCLIFNKCLTTCKDDGVCRDECAKSNPVGADRYQALLTCIVCQVCPKSCVDFASFCL